jgi:hypothetical protein
MLIPKRESVAWARRCARFLAGLTVAKRSFMSRHAAHNKMFSPSSIFSRMALVVGHMSP